MAAGPVLEVLTRELDGRTTTVVDRGEGWHASGTTVPDILTGSEPVISSSGEPAEGSIDFVPPYRPPTIHGIGLNFRDTVTDMGWETPKAPFLFPKLSSSACGPNDDNVVDPRLTTRVDREAELGVVIGRPAKNVPVDTALSHVAGYVAANDVSARDLQANDGQWVRGKGLDTFCPLGPWILTSDELDDPSRSVSAPGSTESSCRTAPPHR